MKQATRRQFLAMAVPAAVVSAASGVPFVVPVHHVLDVRAKCTPEQLHRFGARIWPEAVRDFGRCGILLQARAGTGEMRSSPGGRPIFAGLARGAINMVLTSRIPLYWDEGRALPGVSTRYEGFDLCVVALEHAHPHQVPFLSVNTCVHELLHVLLRDVAAISAKGVKAALREFRIDVEATLLRLPGGCAAVRKAGRAYVDGLRSAPARI